MMEKASELGSRVALPSGKIVSITAPADVNRPWQAVHNKGIWNVCRPQGRSGSAGAAFYYGGQAVPLQLDETDARRLAELLNGVRPGTYPG